jgi:acyl-CoA reductase-like NAD-dependent aldehyde dehydrogenase
MSPEDIAAAIDRVSTNAEKWFQTTFAERLEYIRDTCER